MLRYVCLPLLLAALWCAGAAAQIVHSASLAVSGDSALAPRVERYLRRELRKLGSVRLRKPGSRYAISATVALNDSGGDPGRVEIVFSVSSGYTELLSVIETGTQEDLRALCSGLIRRLNDDVLMPAEAEILNSI